MNKKMEVENREFLEVGIERYEEACDTIAVFEREMGAVLERVVRNRQSWKPLRNKKIKHTTSAPPASQYGYWIAIEITGKSPSGQDVAIDCGFWWKNAKIDRPIIYANYYKKPKAICNFLWSTKSNDICSFSGWGRTFLYLPLTKVGEIESGLNHVLEALLKKLK